MWAIALAKSAASPEKPGTEHPQPLHGLDVSLPTSCRIGNADLHLIGTVFFLLLSQEFLCG